MVNKTDLQGKIGVFFHGFIYFKLINYFSIKDITNIRSVFIKIEMLLNKNALMFNKVLRKIQL